MNIEYYHGINQLYMVIDLAIKCNRKVGLVCPNIQGRFTIPDVKP